MAGSSFTPSYQGLGDNVLRADFMVAEMGRRIRNVMALAEATAPVYTGPGEDTHRGRYKASYSVSTTDHGGWRSNRAAGVLTDSAPEALFVEVGVRPDEHEPHGQRAHHTMMNALRRGAGD